MKKKIFTIFFMMLFIVTSTLSVKSFAAINSAKLELNPSKTQYKIGDTVEVTLKLSEIKADKGIITYGGTLDYDKDKLEYKGMKGLNGWANPDYNADNGKFVSDGNEPTLNGEDLCVITFEAKSEGDNVPIKVNEMEVANGDKVYKTEAITTSVNIQDNPNSSNPGGNSGNNNQGGNGSGGNNNSGNNSGNSGNSGNNNSGSGSGSDSGSNSGNGSSNSGNNNSGSTSGNKTNGGTTTNKNSGSASGTSQNTANKIIPQTGIDSNYILASLLMAVIVVGIIAVKIIRVNRKNK